MKRGCVTTIVLSTLLFVSVALSAQERGDYIYIEGGDSDIELEMIEVDTTLFRLAGGAESDYYGEAVRYYRAPVATRRRGQYYTTARELTAPLYEDEQSFRQRTSLSQVALYGGSRDYEVALRSRVASALPNGWVVEGNLWMQSGRSGYVQGVFTSYLLPQLSLSRLFDDGSSLSLSAECGYKLRGLQFGATEEAVELTSNRYYNPSWGYYNGEVRNSKVRREFLPSVVATYERSLTELTSVKLSTDIELEREANSSLGWYNASTPMPDYYRKMPSYMPYGQIRDYTTELWRTQNSDYTQINWDELVRQNGLSSSGRARYALEDRVELSRNYTLSAMAVTQTSLPLKLTYGVEFAIEHSRYFKQMRDLLGAAYLVDHDIRFGDSYNASTALVNDLRNPQRVVCEGDRFGYDFEHRRTLSSALLRADYRTAKLDITAEAKLSQESTLREGYFEKERFSGKASFGESAGVDSSPYSLRVGVGYGVGAQHYFLLRGQLSELSPQSRSLFLNDYASNFLSGVSGGEKIRSLSLSHTFKHRRFTLHSEIYAIVNSNGSAIYYNYDDLSEQMCRALITDIGYRSLGVELTSNIAIRDDLQATATIALGDYRYSGSPMVELFSEENLERLVEPTSTSMSGLRVGNAPSLYSTLALSYFGLKRYIINVVGSYSALRYAQPSIIRRNERLLSQAFISAESRAESLSQERLNDVCDVELSVTRFIYLRNQDRIDLRLRISNLLGDSGIINYAKESDRVMLLGVDDSFVGAAVMPSLYQYGAPRTLLLSVCYNF